MLEEKKISKKLKRPKTIIPIFPASRMLLECLKTVGMVMMSTKIVIKNQAIINGRTNSINPFFIFFIPHLSCALHANKGARPMRPKLRLFQKEECSESRLPAWR